MRRSATLILLAITAACSRSPAPAADAAPVAAPPVPALPVATTSASASAAADDPAHKHEDRQEAKDDGGAPLRLAVTIGGKATVWQADAFAKAPRFALGKDGEGRDVWSLRDLVHALVGPSARATIVTGPRETRRLDLAAWNDTARIPILHTTRRGTLKFRWADRSGAWGDTEVVDVSSLDITP